MSLALIIPARLGATRLPDKPLCSVNGQPLIQHVWRSAVQANLGPVFVATDSQKVAQIITHAGGQAVLTDPDLPSGSDRVYAALRQIDPAGHFQTILNLQGDLAVFPPHLLHTSFQHAIQSPLWAPILTLAKPLRDADRCNPHVVKAVLAPEQSARNTTNASPHKTHAPAVLAAQGCRLAENFVRLPESTVQPEPDLWHHIGVYAFQRAALQAFTQLLPTPREEKYQLEQLRLLDHGWTMGVQTLPESDWISVDTPADLERANTAVSV